MILEEVSPKITSACKGRNFLPKIKNITAEVLVCDIKYKHKSQEQPLERNNDMFSLQKSFRTIG